MGYSPLIIHFIVRCFTGVVLNEAKQKRKPAFRIYMQETNVFTPWCYKRIKGKEREEMMEKFTVDIAEELKEQEGSLVYGLFKKSWRRFLFNNKADDNPLSNKIGKIDEGNENGI